MVGFGDFRNSFNSGLYQSYIIGVKVKGYCGWHGILETWTEDYFGEEFFWVENGIV